jgi:hypothetical protein
VKKPFPQIYTLCQKKKIKKGDTVFNLADIIPKAIWTGPQPQSKLFQHTGRPGWCRKPRLAVALPERGTASLGIELFTEIVFNQKLDYIPVRTVMAGRA